MPFDVITCGSATVDYFIHTKQEPLDLEQPKTGHLLCYPLGAKLLVDRLRHKIGGGGTNTAWSFQKLGLRTGYVGCIGKDKEADRILRALRDQRITFLGMRHTRDTDCSFILDSSGRDRTILVYRSASEALDFRKLPKTKLKATWLYFSASIGHAAKAAEDLARHAKQQGAQVAYNPSQYLIREQSAHVHRMLRRSDVLILNREEAELLTGKTAVPYDTLLHALRSLGPEIVVVTDGRNGAHAADNERTYFAAAHQIQIAETTGAGDAFAAAFVTGFAKTRSMVFALELGTTNAESCIEQVGAKEGLLSWKQAIARMHRMPVTVQRSI